MLKAQTRQPQTKLNELRREGKLPAVLYGRGFESVPVLLDYTQFTKEIKKHGEGALLDLQIDKAKPFKALLQDSQKDPVRQDLIHLDLYRVRMDEKLTTQIVLKFIGEPPAVRVGGVVVKSRDHLEVECLPGDLVSDIEVDLSSLAEIHDSLEVADIAVPRGITVLDEKDLTVASIAAPVEEEEDVSKEQEKAAIEELGKEGAEGKEEEKKEGEEKKQAEEEKKEGN